MHPKRMLGLLALVGTVACLPHLVSAPPSAIPIGPNGRAVASVSRVSWMVSATGEPTVDVPVHLRFDRPFTLTVEPGTERLTLAFAGASWWLDETGTCVYAPRDDAMALLTEDGLLGWVRPFADVWVADARLVEGGAVFTFVRTDVDPHWIRSDWVVASYRREVDGAHAFTAALAGDVWAPPHNPVLVPTARGTLVSYGNPLATSEGDEAVVSAGTWQIDIDGSIRPITPLVFRKAAVDGDRVWGIEYQGRRRRGPPILELIGMRDDGRVFFRQPVGGIGEVHAYRDLVCVDPGEGTRECFDLDGHRSSDAVVPRDHLIVTADGWSVVQSDGLIEVHDAAGRLAWSQATSLDSSNVVVTPQGRVCSIARRAGSGLRRLVCWGGVAASGTNSQAFSARNTRASVSTIVAPDASK